MFLLQCLLFPLLYIYLLIFYFPSKLKRPVITFQTAASFAFFHPVLHCHLPTNSDNFAFSPQSKTGKSAPQWIYNQVAAVGRGLHRWVGQIFGLRRIFSPKK
jgi:hypothetical protein